MECKLRFVGGPLLVTSAIALPLCLSLSGCGGDGTLVASLPSPPPTPTPTPPTATPTPTPTPTPSPTPQVTPVANAYPVSTVGTYDLLGRLTIDPATGNAGDWTDRTTAPGEFTLNVTSPTAGLSYKLNASPGILPAGFTSIDFGTNGSWSINEDDYLRAQYVQAQPFGTSSTGASVVEFDAGFSYVSMGEWNWPVLLNGNPQNATNFGQLLFVFGNRTPPSAIPLSGTATYDAHSLFLLNNSGDPGIPFTLTADFGLRTIAARIDQDFQNFGSGPDASPIQGIHVGGSAPFSNGGSFDIALTGTVNYSYQNMPAPPPSEAATGYMNGAFFGPHAEQVGGTFFLQRPGDRLPLFQDAFVDKQH